ncbi:MAG: sporulation initiation factor Spo0A C-terminal domain-containing protein [Clostridia bacterium]|nr:sporulation initiation factor Spo0A C-terminal domain-containing protein [Clostridia bacterium]
MSTDIQKRIINELLGIGYNIKYKGTQLLAEAICIAYESRNLAIVENLEKNIYVILAEKYNKSIECIKMNIANATNIMYSVCEEKKMKAYFHIVDDYKPTPKYVIVIILSKIE